MFGLEYGKKIRAEEYQNGLKRYCEEALCVTNISLNDPWNIRYPWNIRSLEPQITSDFPLSDNFL